MKNAVDGLKYRSSTVLFTYAYFLLSSNHPPSAINLALLSQNGLSHDEGKLVLHFFIDYTHNSTRRCCNVQSAEAFKIFELARLKATLLLYLSMKIIDGFVKDLE